MERREEHPIYGQEADTLENYAAGQRSLKMTYAETDVTGGLPVCACTSYTLSQMCCDYQRVVPSFHLTSWMIEPTSSIDATFTHTAMEEANQARRHDVLVMPDLQQ